MIKQYHEGHQNAPMIVCDICGEKVSGNGAAVLTRDVPEKTFGPVLHVHKGKCHDAAEKQFQDKGMDDAWDELGDHMVQLFLNAGFDESTIRKYHERLRVDVGQG